MPLRRATLMSLPLAVLPLCPAQALTAEEVWADWLRLAQQGGVTISATTRREGDRLVLRDITLPVGPPEEQLDLKLDRVDLQDLPDGRVAVILPPQFPVTFDLRSPDPDFDLVTLTASAPEFEMVVTGIGSTSAFEMSAPSITLALDRLLPATQMNERLDINLALADLAISHQIDLVSATQMVTSKASLAALHGDVFADNGTDVKASAAFDLAGVFLGLNMVVPPGFADAAQRRIGPDENPLVELRRMFDEGLRMSGDAAFTGLNLRLDMSESAEKGYVEMTMASGKASGHADPEAVGYEIAIGPVSFLGRDLPEMTVPEVAMSLDELGYGFSIGIGDLVSPQDARVWARLIDLTLPPEAWAEADPSGVLGVAPVSLALDASMRYALGAEMLEPGWQPVPGQFPPMDIVEVTLKELIFNGLGIAVQGNGALSFDESDLTTFDGVPAPAGKLSFNATGVNGLLDRLSGAGMVPEDELMEIPMGLMMIAKAGTAADSLVSDIEFRDKGFFLNGMKIR